MSETIPFVTAAYRPTHIRRCIYINKFLYNYIVDYYYFNSNISTKETAVCQVTRNIPQSARIPLQIDQNRCFFRPAFIALTRESFIRRLKSDFFFFLSLSNRFSRSRLPYSRGKFRLSGDPDVCRQPAGRLANSSEMSTLGNRIRLRQQLVWTADV